MKTGKILQRFKHMMQRGKDSSSMQRKWFRKVSDAFDGAVKNTGEIEHSGSLAILQSSNRNSINSNQMKYCNLFHSMAE
jgi:hypothetical protein